jgi:hypothetical protein
MTAYKELCKAFFTELPRREAIDRMLRELPAKMAQAISDYLAAPSGYVEPCKTAIDRVGRRTWQRCEDDCLQADSDGVYGFCISVRAEYDPGSLNHSIMYFAFSVEDFDEQSIQLRIKNLDGKISIADAHDPASYANAAKATIERLVSNLKNPKATSGSRAPIGFVSQP